MNETNQSPMKRRHFLCVALAGLPCAGLLARVFAGRTEQPGAGAETARAPGPDAGPEAGTLAHWRRAARMPVVDMAGADADDRTAFLRSPEDAAARRADFAMLFAAMESQCRISFCYDGGSTPGRRRVVTPAGMFRVEGYPGSVYLAGYCHVRCETRTFNVSRIWGLETG